eukprot:jgi/Tetstr1/429602/TSEL_019500.t1
MPLAAASFSVAIHLELECNKTLEATCGAARFNASDGYLVGMPEHVWPVLCAFRTSIKAVGLEPEYNVQAYRRGKAEELHEEVGASLSTLLMSAKPTRRVERVLGVTFDPSTYGTDANSVVTGFFAELLHDQCDHDPAAGEAATTLSEDALAWRALGFTSPLGLVGVDVRRVDTVSP